jgi:hypothetical protein
LFYQYFRTTIRRLFISFLGQRLKPAGQASESKYRAATIGLRPGTEPGLWHFKNRADGKIHSFPQGKI